MVVLIDMDARSSHRRKGATDERLNTVGRLDRIKKHILYQFRADTTCVSEMWKKNIQKNRYNAYLLSPKAPILLQ